MEEPSTCASPSVSTPPTERRTTAWTSETRMRKLALKRWMKHVVRPTLRTCAGNAVRRSNSDRHIVHQAVARPPSVYQARARVFKGAP